VRLQLNPMVSVVLTTRDRPRLLSVALACYRQQTYPYRELVVVDDGKAHPVSPESVEAVGGHLMRVPAGTPIGTKLNLGVRASGGTLCHKMDDDDWYAPDFLKHMVNAWLAARQKVCKPAFALLAPFLFFDVRNWQLRRSRPGLATGATLLFSREDWEEQPFREVRRDDDEWFMRDQNRLGRMLIPVAALHSFLSVRHEGAAGERGHTWRLQSDGGPTDDRFVGCDWHDEKPEDLLPDWALTVYRDIRDRIRTAREEDQRLSVER
jgi:glycosyltransferase involved in cell wall biosynthesis